MGILTYSKNFLASYQPTNTNPQDITNERVADIYGQVYLGRHVEFGSLLCIANDGTLVGERSFQDIYEEFVIHVNDPAEAVSAITGGNVAVQLCHNMIGDGRYILVSMVVVDGPGGGNPGSQYKRFFLLYECRDGQYPLFKDGFWTSGQESLIGNTSFICGQGTDDDPICMIGRYDPFVGFPDFSRVYVLPSINEILTNTLDAWWLFTSATHTPYQHPLIEYRFSSQDGNNLDRAFSDTGNPVRSTQGARAFKLDRGTSTELLWYVTKRGLEDGTSNSWVDNNIAPNHVGTGALVGLDLGIVNPSTVAPTGTDNTRAIFTATASDQTAFLQPLMPDDGKEIATPANDGDTIYANPKVLRYDGKQYVVFILVSYDATDIASASPDIARTQLVRVKLYEYDEIEDELVFVDEEEGAIFDDQDFFDGAGGTYWGIHNIGSYVQDNGEFIIAGVNGVDLGSIKQRNVWWTSFGIFTLRPPGEGPNNGYINTCFI